MNSSQNPINISNPPNPPNPPKTMKDYINNNFIK